MRISGGHLVPTADTFSGVKGKGSEVAWANAEPWVAFLPRCFYQGLTTRGWLRQQQQQQLTVAVAITITYEEDFTLYISMRKGTRA